MKKFTTLHIVIVAVLALVVGFLIGIAIQSTSLFKSDLAGSIGKVDRYRNVKVTEEDILLRNELADDTLKRSQYEKYLKYYYYKSMKTSSDIDQVLKLAQSAGDFQKSSASYARYLAEHKTYLDNTRPDILNALNMIITLDKDQDVPVIGFLNQAQNSISRIRLQGSILMNYMNAISAFVAELPAGTYKQLEDANDILTLNVMEMAILTQDRPVLKYFEKTRLLNDKEGVKELRSQDQFNNTFLDQFANDAEVLGFGNVEKLQDYLLGDVEKFNAIMNEEKIGSVEFGNQELLQIIVFNAEKLGLLNTDNLGVIILLDSPDLIGSHEL